MVLPVVVESSSAGFFANLRTDSAMIASVDCTRVSMLSPSARVTWVKLTDEDALNAFLD